MDKNFYITTPIYYPSAKPHMGHAYSSIIADFFARFKKIDGFSVFFLTGTDEHGLKIQRAAEQRNLDPLELCDQISQTFKDLSKTLNLTNTDFIRTTEERHKKSVKYLWKELKKIEYGETKSYSEIAKIVKTSPRYVGKVCGQNKHILITGEAGHIGSHTCKLLDKIGITPVTIDNLIYGHKDFVNWGLFYEGHKAIKMVSNSKRS